MCILTSDAHRSFTVAKPGSAYAAAHCAHDNGIFSADTKNDNSSDIP